MSVDDGLIRAWLAARSVSRGLPPPIADHGGWRVDSGQPAEARRYVFSAAGDGLRALGASIDAPWIALKLCAPLDELLALLPQRWRPTSDLGSMVMRRDGATGDLFDLPAGYRIDIARDGAVTSARVHHGEDLAASAYAAEGEGVFIYDRVVTEAAHRRRGLGAAMMTALARTRRDPAAREVLTATPSGRALYLTIGWRDYSAYSTATIPADEQTG